MFRSLRSCMLNSISRLGETRHEQEWSNGTEFSGYSESPANLARYAQNFGMKFRRMSVPFAPNPEFPEFLVEWKAPPGLAFIFAEVLTLLP